MSQAGILNAVEIPFPPGDIPIDFVTNSGTAVASANVLNILGGSGATTSASGNTITITATGTGFTWNVVNSTMNPVALSPENGYIPKLAGSVNFVLPATASVGDTYKIVGYGNLWSITQPAAFQTITLGIKTTTAGVMGYIQATSPSDCAELVCVTANLEWVITDAVGNLTIF